MVDYNSQLAKIEESKSTLNSLVEEDDLIQAYRLYVLDLELFKAFLLDYLLTNGDSNTDSTTLIPESELLIQLGKTTFELANARRKQLRMVQNYFE